jgi:two-component system chemotaxis response regulator CheB
MPPVRVIVVDDSALVRRVVGGMLSLDPEIDLVGTAVNGKEALERIAVLKPDVLVLDIEIPVLNGLKVLGRLMRTQPLPVIVLSSHTRVGARVTLEALSLGAVDFVPKPENQAELVSVVNELAVKVKAAAKTQVAKAVPGIRQKVPDGDGRFSPTTVSAPGRRKLVVIGSSTGGPAALQRIIPELPGDLPAGVVVVQHIPAGFSSSLADHLAKTSAIKVKHAADGDPVLQGQVLIAPAGADFYFHSTNERLEVKLLKSIARPAPGVFHPSVDEVMISAARLCGPKVLGVLLTGMGRDGARGMLEIKKKEGRTIAEAEESCVVFGMPKAAIENGAVDKIVPLKDIAREIVGEL